MNAKTNFPSIAEPLEQVETELQRQVERISETWRRESGHRDRIDHMLQHLLQNPGKLLRPALVLLSAGLADSRSLERSKTVLVQLATTVELIHCASLIHDDIIDNEQMGRGKASLHSRYGNQTAVLLGDILYSQSFNLLTHLQLPSWDLHRELFRIFCDATRDMCVGEIIEQRFLERNLGEGASAIDLHEYLEIAREKTAALMSACCRSAGVSCGADSDTIVELSSFGMNFGLAFQLFDDYTDKDALISPAVDLPGEANRFLSQSRDILAQFPDSPYREELSRACSFIAEGLRRSDE